MNPLNGLTLQLPIMGQVTAKNPASARSPSKTGGGAVFEVLTKPATWFDTVTNLDRLYRQRLPIDQYAQVETAGDQPGPLEANVTVGDLIAVESVQYTYGDKFRYEAMTAHLLKSHRERGLATGAGGGAHPLGRRLAAARQAGGGAGGVWRVSEDRSAAGDQDPSNTYWQRDLAAAHSRVGDVLQSQGKLAETQTEFGEYLKISRRLADQDPSNAYWQRDLAAIYVEMGRLASQMGMNTTALPLYEEASRIFGTLVMSSPGFTEWAEEKETVDSELRLCRTKDIS